MKILFIILLFAAVQCYILGKFAGMGPLYFLLSYEKEVKALEEKNPVEEHQNEILFYGASNFRMWETMKEDTEGYPTLNHGFGGADDAMLVQYADRLLYPYHPSVIILQTGSNDYVHIKAPKSKKVEILFKKKIEMFEQFHEKLPDAKILVCAGILMYGRSNWTNEIKEMNVLLKNYCSTSEYVKFIDSEEMTLKDGMVQQDCFIKDGIHLKPEMRIIWWNRYIKPVLDTIYKK